ncbi:carbohydrate-binding module family 14 protein [Parasedimentitalea psychrophila]|uniref:Carbohydrate-binding module family 14 protein n=1 Tax=Parasedimentitalea psychrophila TaxID=2997337 RepID=A0A9Y2P0Y2_9RHOB|nr:carbohydrate-binding module family 14 protein [Parasedimentitalea psychrophila]WIY23612.1 carbohydrate-binding module family 14 protein [Parasedimentitalea psychrophila]
MSTKFIVAAFVVLMSASTAIACSQHSQQVQSCGAGTVWNAETQSCTKQISG